MQTAINLFQQQALRLKHLRKQAASRMAYADQTNQRRNSEMEAQLIERLNTEIYHLEKKRL